MIKRGEQGETAYVNQFWTVRNRSVGTKHVFVGETRVSSKVIPGDDHVNPGNDKWAGVLGQWWLHRSAQGWANGKNTIKNPHYASNAMPDNLPEDNFVFFYHPDHLGSTEYVTDAAGELYEHVQYFAFGETWVSEHKNTETLPYLFTSKELDEETGLYYFGARYYDPRTSVWQSMDPALDEYLSRESSAIHQPKNLALSAYAWQSPLLMRDPTGLHPDSVAPHEVHQICAGQGGCTPAERRELLNQYREAGKAAAQDVALTVAGGVVAGRIAAAVARARAAQRAARAGAAAAEVANTVKQAESATQVAARTSEAAAQVAGSAGTQVGEALSGYRIIGTKALQGKTFVRDIMRIETGAGAPRFGRIGRLLKTMEAEARAAGATELKIIQRFPVGPFKDPRFAKHFGFKFKKVGETAVELAKKLD